MSQVEVVTSERGLNPIFPGFYREKDSPGNVGYVTKVSQGRVSWRGTKGSTRSALMGSMEFMRRYERVS